MKTYLLFGLTLSMAIGCTTSYTITREPGANKFSFAQLNEDAKGQPCSILTIRGEEMRATNLFVADDSTSFLEFTTKRRISIATSSVQTIAIRRAGAGAVDGILPGAIAGAGVGIWLVAEGIKGFGDLSATGYLVLGGGPLLAGGLLGAAVGAMVGHTDEYLFQSQRNTFQNE